jgi:WXXGXW repeat (2 copies)
MMRLAWLRSLPLVIVTLAAAYSSAAQISITVGFAPPELPVYEQPLCPGDGYIWTPGYWAWDSDGDDYYWVPGTWVLAPEVGYFWTPPYWGWGSGVYIFYPGYWGPHIGFYGGINYGFGYFGHGYDGGRWENGHFFYNHYVNNVNVTVIHNVYETRVDERNVNVARVSYNGGSGGVNARPTPEEESFAHERHVAATPAQMQHFNAARGNPQFRASNNHGKPPVAATAKSGEFSGHDVVPARQGGKYTPPPNRGNGTPTAAENNRPPNAVHPKELPPMEKGNPPNTGDPKLDQKYQQQQAKLYEKQNQERQKLQQKQDQEHQKFTQQQAKAAQQQANEEQKRQMEQRQQQMEQKHQQQTQQMVQKHTQQQQHMQQSQAPPPQQHGGSSQHH